LYERHDSITFAFSSTLLHFGTLNRGDGRGEEKISEKKRRSSDSI